MIMTTQNKSQLRKACLLLLLSLTSKYLAPEVAAQAAAAGGVVSPIQSTADPMRLSIAGPVMAAGSDAAAANFQTTIPSMVNFIHTSLPEYQNNSKSPLVHAIDPAKLTLLTKSDLRVYFAYEGAGYHNTIGFNTTGVGVSSGNPQILFPDASSSIGLYGSGTGIRSASEPLLPGDFVNAGTFNAGTKLDFFLIANGANGGTTTFSTAGTANPDGLTHVASFTPSVWGVANSPYLFISYEDLLGGGDKDYNDVIIAIDIGAANMRALLATPEPATWLTLGSLVGLVIWARGRQQREPLLVVATARS